MPVSWAKLVHHSVAPVTPVFSDPPAMPSAAPLVLKGLGNVSVGLEGGRLSFGLLIF